jgi:hypothetical protein
VRSPKSIDAYVDFCRCEARAILTDHTDTVIALAAAMIERQVMTRAEIDAVIGRAIS